MEKIRLVRLSGLLLTRNMMVLGKKLQNVGPNWYIEKAGSFCSRCRLAYDFDETLMIYLKCRQLGLAHGIPRCIHCGRTLRTRSKPRYESGFWKRLKKIKENGEYKKRQKLFIEQEELY